MRKTKAQKRHGARWMKLRKAYLAIRKQSRGDIYPSGIRAKDAIAHARAHFKAPDIEWTDHTGNPRGEFKLSGFRIVVTVRPDDDASAASEDLGRYTDSPTAADYRAGVIDRAHGIEPGELDCPISRRELRYFVPSNLRGCIAENREWLNRYGYPRHVADCLARSYPRQDFERAEALNNGDWCPMIVTAKAYRGGIELGSSSLGGIESDAGQDYIDGIARDCASEAVSEARAALARLRR